MYAVQSAGFQASEEQDSQWDACEPAVSLRWSASTRTLGRKKKEKKEVLSRRLVLFETAFTRVSIDKSPRAASRTAIQSSFRIREMFPPLASGLHHQRLYCTYSTWLPWHFKTARTIWLHIPRTECLHLVGLSRFDFGTHPTMRLCNYSLQPWSIELEYYHSLVSSCKNMSCPALPACLLACSC